MRRYVIILTVLLVAGAALAQAPATDKVGSWLSDKPEVPLSLPDDGQPKEKDNLPPEHSLITSRKAKLSQDQKSGYWVLKFAPQAGKPDMPDHYVLPSLLLEDMERALAKDAARTFVVSGETLIYTDPSTKKRQAFLLVRLALMESDQVLTPAPAKAPAPAPTSAPAATQPTREPTADDVLQRLLAQKPATPLLPRPDDAEPLEIPASVAPVVRQQLKLSFGNVLADRVVRILPEDDGKWQSVRFDADNTLQDQPMRALPCGLLTKAQELSKTESGQSVKLIVSGEMLTYKGKQYLLLRKVVKQRNMHQF